MKSIVLGSVIAVSLANGASWPLTNGSFEEADPGQLIAPGPVDPALALPGWQGGPYSPYYIDGFAFFGSTILFDAKARETDVGGLINTLPLAGNVGVGVIPNAFTSGGQVARPPFLEQPSLVPIGAKSLWFLWQGERLDLRINGELTPFMLAEQRLTDDPFVPIHDYYAADISQYAGQEATIRFEFFANELHPFPPWPGAVQALDDIYFSSIPEPGTLTLFALGAGWLLLTARSAKRRRRSS